MFVRDPIPTPDALRRPSELARLEMARLAVEEDRPLPGVFRRICEIAADTLQVERVGIWLLTADHQAMRCANLYERSRREHSEGVTFRLDEFPEYFRAVSSRRALPTELAQSDPRTAELRDAYLIPLSIASMLDAPVLKSGEMIGVVCHEQVGPSREWTTEERDFAMSVADAVASKIKSAELLIARSAIRHHAELAPGGDRLEIVGRLAAGVAHDFKNLLTVVMGNAGLIARRPDLPADVTQRANNIVEASERGAELVRELLEFGREPGGHARVLDVSELVESFLPILQSSIGADSQIEFTCEPGAGRVMIDRGNLERVLLNLVFNARDAMPTGGPIRLHVAPDQTTDGDGPPGAYVRTDVSDNGVGIPPEAIERIFDPSYTTKPKGKGTGLGLAVVRRIVDRAGGFVRVESVPGHLTTFRVYLPRVTGENGGCGQ
jgi:two-component system cell cycle sensor histidine kinase/response regulator CckA